MEEGQVVLYRGIGSSQVLRRLRFVVEGLLPAQRAVWRTYLRLQARMLEDSVLSFNTVHDRIRRTETCYLRDGTWLADDLAKEAGLDIESPGFASNLWRAGHQAYALERWVADRKFGPHYGIFKIPLSNIRLTTFFAGEAEVRIVDPGLLSLMETVGCSVMEVDPQEPFQEPRAVGNSAD